MKKLLIVSLVFGTALMLYKFYKDKLHNEIILPEPTGLYAVGTQRLYLIDVSRPEKHNLSMNRELVVTVYYPVKKLNTVPFYGPYLSEYREYIKTDISQIKQIDIKKLEYVDHLTSYAISHAEISNQSSMYPVIIFSPGFGAPQETYSLYLEDLASHGYIVFGINYPYVTNPIIFSDSRIIYQSEVFKGIESERYKKLEFNTWLADINFLISELKIINAQNIILQNKLNLDQIGIMGHSFGGRMAVEAAQRDNKIKAGIDLDGKLDSNMNLDNFDTPFMFIVADREDNKDQNFIEQFIKKDKQDAFLVIIKGADHGTFTDLNLVFKPWFYKGKLDPLRGIEIVRTYIVNFFDKYLKNDSKLLSKYYYSEVKILEN